jgi:hypothetical protein
MANQGSPRPHSVPSYARGRQLDEETRKEMLGHLDQLRAELQATGSRDAQSDVTLLEHVEHLQALMASDRDPGGAAKAARGLEQRLLAWEAEHPQLTALAARVARALESSGL